MIALLTLLSIAAVADQRVAVIIGNNRGLEGEEILDYAERDAERMHDFLTSAGQVSPDRAYLLRGSSTRNVVRTLGEAIGRIRELQKLDTPTSLIVYVSAHADAEALHLNGERWPIAELRSLVADTKADLRLIILDACQRDVELRTKGGVPGPEVEVAIDRSSRLEGDVMISSASRGESAQEWTRLEGSLFTHHLLSALRGVADVDRNGKVTLIEAYAYAFNRTLASSVATGVTPQHPAFDMDMRGFGQWTFAEPEKLGASITLGPELEGTVWVLDRKSEMVAEVAKSSGEKVNVAVRPGWYRVVLPRGERAGVAEVNLAFGGERMIEGSMLVQTTLERARLRGGAPLVLRPWTVALGYTLASGSVRGVALQHGLTVTTSREVGDYTLRMRVDASYGRGRNELLGFENRELVIAAGGAYRFEPWILRVDAGVEAGFATIMQDVARHDEEEVARAFGVREPSRTAVYPLGGAYVAGALPISDRWWLSVESGARIAERRTIGDHGLSLDTRLAFAIATTY